MQDNGASWWQVSTKSQFICQHVNYAHRSGREKMACRRTRIQRGMSFFPGDRYSTQSFNDFGFLFLKKMVITF
jgi:hypothetical protein